MSEPAEVIRGAIARPLLETHGLVLEVGGRRLIDGLDVRLRARRKTVVLGANGAGKSLLLRLLHGLLIPSAGEVLWYGRPLDREARFRQAMVFQRPVPLRRSVEGNLRFILGARGIRGVERRVRVADALERAGLGTLAHRPARVLSGGEQQRLAIAGALACRAEVLFLDEPSASLDPAATQALEELLEGAHRSGVTIILVTHDKGQARRLADDVVFLHAGKVVETGRAADVLDRPRSEAARAWMDGRLYLDKRQ